MSRESYKPADAKPTYDAAVYQVSRPTYPPEVFATIYDYHASAGPCEWQRCVDLGCGTGQATRVLADRFTEVLGVDALQNMVEIAQASTTYSNVRYEVSTAEKLPFLSDNSIDLVTSFEAAHYFNFPDVWPELARVLKPNGTVAFFNYSVARVAKHPTLTNAFTEFMDSSLKQYKVEPGYSINDSLLDVVACPGPPFVESSIRRIKFTGDHLPRSQVSEPRPVMFKQYLTWEQTEMLVRSWSCYPTFQADHPEDREQEGGDIASRFAKLLKERVIADGGDKHGVDVESLSGLMVVKKSS